MHWTDRFSAGMGGTYAFVSTASANLREKNDPWNHFWGGMTGGALLGLRSKQHQSLEMQSGLIQL
jgi:Tim17/Tim22/Tim23/Pmp24 family